MKKVTVLDTCVLVQDPESLFGFEKSDIVVPEQVLEELDKHKTRQDLVGYNARVSIHILDNLIQDNKIEGGIKLGKDLGKLFFKSYNRDLIKDEGLDLSVPDNKIIATAITLKKENLKSKICIATRDINLKVKCCYYGIESINYNREDVIQKREQLYSGFTKVIVNDDLIDELYAGKQVSPKQIHEELLLYPNQFVLFVSDFNEKKSILCKYDGNLLVRVNEFKKGIFGIRSKNKEQSLVLELLMDKTIQLVSLTGGSGSGKTILSLAAGLQQVVESKNYSRILIVRPIQPVGADIGFLPGDVSEKMEPWMAPISDNFVTLLGGTREAKLTYEQFRANGTIEVQPLTYIRGRSISDTYMILDEAQNMSLHELKTIITRAGQNTKIVITGDIEQIDNNKLNEFTNGLTLVVEKIKSEKLSGHISLRKCERSELAELGIKL